MSRIRWHAIAGVAAAAAVVLGLVVVAPASGAATVTATFEKTQSWDTGWEGRYTIRNSGSAELSGWRLTFTLGSGSVTSAWDAQLSSSGTEYTFANLSWNGTIPAGGSASFGFNASGTGTPTGCALNGVSCDGGSVPPTTTTTPTTSNPPDEPGEPGEPGQKLVGYFANWGVYDRHYYVKNIATSRSAAKLTHINYAFGNVQGGRCAVGDSYADYEKTYSAADSVDGVGDTWDQPLAGNFNQLRKLKKMYPGLKVIWSFGGWTWSGGFGEAARNPEAFADSCYKLVEDPRWADVFDGIDIDWEYPNACGLTCDTSGPKAFGNLVKALRSRFGSNLVTAAITADASSGGKIDATDYAAAAQYVDWYMVMTYDFFGAWDTTGPTAPHSPLRAYDGIPNPSFNTDSAITKLKGKGVPPGKLLLGIGFYGRGWTGVTQLAPGGRATGPARGTYEQGIEDYKVLKNTCRATNTIAGTAYGLCGSDWWSYDTPDTIRGKRTYAGSQSLGGMFFWELSGDTSDGELISAMSGS
ncbi:glycosyl hydrolase family 18 protein [Goodfellowiella coeruleoviolacea]|uniref:chitinase n=1 Tax=Goodfellowiella coeruleoviolacea TaxID=334858 RepID=A0AAE3GLA8_9PSEU|nr:glycosyl hydrolase family 18 protein [Goodfellowiella coeruleoviolacea]MCP2170140.1 chitinase family 18 [Goodfellowiella coeruleoviolacea]